MYRTFLTYGSYEMYLKVLAESPLMNGEAIPAEEAARICMLVGSAQAAKIWGCRDAVGFLQGTLLLADSILSMDELVKKSDYSKSTVSTCMGILEDLGFVRRVIKPGDKRHYYVSIEGCEAVFKAHIENFKQSSQIFLSALEEAEEHLEKGRVSENEKAERLRHRLKSIKEDSIRLQKMIDLTGLFTVEELIDILEREVRK